MFSVNNFNIVFHSVDNTDKVILHFERTPQSTCGICKWKLYGMRDDKELGKAVESKLNIRKEHSGRVDMRLYFTRNGVLLLMRNDREIGIQQVEIVQNEYEFNALPFDLEDMTVLNMLRLSEEIKVYFCRRNDNYLLVDRNSRQD